VILFGIGKLKMIVSNGIKGYKEFLVTKKKMLAKLQNGGLIEFIPKIV
jgi:hypothetical protein